MGGNALKNTATRRYSAAEYEGLVPEVMRKLRAVFPGSRLELVKAYRTKPSFGDMDILVESRNLPSDVGKALADVFAPHELVHNGGVWSFDVKEFQVDVIFSSPEEFSASLDYFSWNDLGNLLGRIAHAMGFKYGHRGLTYPLRASETHLVQDVVVTTETDEVLRFLGFTVPGSDVERYRLGFDTLEDTFCFVAGSTYFDPAIYPLEGRSHAARVRDRKRPTYNAFLRWLVEQSPRAGAGSGTINDVEMHLHRALRDIPEFRDRYLAARERMRVHEAARNKVNGAIVSTLTGLAGKALGEFMGRLRSEYPGGASAFTSWAAQATESDVRELVLNQLHKVS